MNRIKQLRKENNITVKDLANEIEYHNRCYQIMKMECTPRNKDVYDRLPIILMFQLVTLWGK